MAGEGEGAAASDDEAPRRGGRPSRQAAEQIRERILDVAAELFLSEGYGATSIEAIAQRARMSKRTFYHRFKDKAELFEAVIRHIVGQLRPADAAPLFHGATVEDILRQVGRLALRAALAPQAIALQRVLLSEAPRFPELAGMINAEGSRREAVDRLSALLEQEIHAGRMALDKPRFAAEQFLQMVVSVPQRGALGLAEALTGTALDAWVDDTVTLFLNGCRGWRGGR